MYVFPFKIMVGDSGPFAFAGFAAGHPMGSTNSNRSHLYVGVQFRIEASGDRLDCMMHVVVQINAAW